MTRRFGERARGEITRDEEIRGNAFAEESPVTRDSRECVRRGITCDESFGGTHSPRNHP